MVRHTVSIVGHSSSRGKMLHQLPESQFHEPYIGYVEDSAQYKEWISYVTKHRFGSEQC